MTRRIEDGEVSEVGEGEDGRDVEMFCEGHRRGSRRYPGTCVPTLQVAVTNPRFVQDFQGSLLETVQWLSKRSNSSNGIAVHGFTEIKTGQLTWSASAPTRWLKPPVFRQMQLLEHLSAQDTIIVD